MADPGDRLDLAARPGLVRRLARWRVDFLRRRCGTWPLPLALARACRTECLYSELVRSSLYPEEDQIECDGSRVANARLSEALRGTQIGWYSLSADSLDYMERLLQRIRVRRVLEFGSGISTLSLAVFLAELHPGGDGPRLVSVEQNGDEVDKTRERLARHGLEGMARVVHSPMTECCVLDRRTLCYDLERPEVRAALEGEPFDFILVDGPMGEPGCRVATLPRVTRYARPGAEFLLDDALRDAEMDIVARGWRRDPAIEVRGVMFVGKGFLTGRIR